MNAPTKIEDAGFRPASRILAFGTFESCKGVIAKMTPKAKRIEANGDFTDYRLEQAYVAEACRMLCSSPE